MEVHAGRRSPDRRVSQRVEKGRIALPPVDHKDRPASGIGHEVTVAINPIGIFGINLDGSDIAGTVEIGLRFGERHEYEGRIVFRHADLEHGRDPVGFDPRRCPHGRHRPLRGNQCDIVTGPQRQLVREPASDRNALALIEVLQRSLLDVVAD